MPSHLHADRSAEQLPEGGSLDALISQARRLRGGIAAMRPAATGDTAPSSGEDDPRARWQRALCDLAAHHLDDLGCHLDQLREGPYTESPGDAREMDDDPRQLRSDGTPAAAYGPGNRTSLTSRVGSADWNLLTDEVSWSGELYAIFGRQPEDGPLTLDDLPSCVYPDDQAALAAAVTECLVDGRPINQEFRIVRLDGGIRSLHMVGEPLLDESGGTASMWAVLRDVSELRRTEQAVRESRASAQREKHRSQPEHRMAPELQEAELPSWRAALGLPGTDGEEHRVGSLDLATHYLPSSSHGRVGGDWYDAMELPDGHTLLSVGELTGHGVAAVSGMAMLLGAVRGMAVAGVAPGLLMTHLHQMLDTSPQPALGSAVCCRYDPQTRALSWAQAGHPAPLLFRDGSARALRPPEGRMLGVSSGTAYGQHTETLQPGDILLLHTDGLTPRSGTVQGTASQRLLTLAPGLHSARTAQECVRVIAEEFGHRDSQDEACVLVARVRG